MAVRGAVGLPAWGVLGGSGLPPAASGFEAATADDDASFYISFIDAWAGVSLQGHFWHFPPMAGTFGQCRQRFHTPPPCLAGVMPQKQRGAEPLARGGGGGVRPTWGARGRDTAGGSGGGDRPSLQAWRVPPPQLWSHGGEHGAAGGPPPCPQRSHVGPGMGHKQGQVLWVRVQKRGRCPKSGMEDGTHRDRQTQERIVPGAKGDFRSSGTTSGSSPLFGLYVLLSIFVN